MNTTLHTFSETLYHLRKTLENEGFLEVMTPTVRRSQGPGMNRAKVDLSGTGYLRTMIGPALRSTLNSHDHVFEIGPCYRDEDSDSTHSSEFVMLDLYAADKCFNWLTELAVRLLEPALLNRKLQTVSVAMVIQQATGVNIGETNVSDAMPLLAPLVNLPLHSKHSEIIDRFIERYVESKTSEGVTLIVDYPVGGSEPCARKRPGTTGVANRFEIFIDGIEVAHGYEDEIELETMIERAKLENLFDNDMEVISQKVLSGAVPKNTVGMGIGIERLCMALSSQHEISAFRFGSDF